MMAQAMAAFDVDVQTWQRKLPGLPGAATQQKQKMEAAERAIMAAKTLATMQATGRLASRAGRQGAARCSAATHGNALTAAQRATLANRAVTAMKLTKGVGGAATQAVGEGAAGGGGSAAGPLTLVERLRAARQARSRAASHLLPALLPFLLLPTYSPLPPTSYFLIPPSCFLPTISPLPPPSPLLLPLTSLLQYLPATSDRLPPTP